MQQRLDRNDTFIQKWSRCLKWNLPQLNVYSSKTTPWFPFPWQSVTKHYDFLLTLTSVCPRSPSANVAQKVSDPFWNTGGKTKHGNTGYIDICHAIMSFFDLMWKANLSMDCTVSRMFLEIHIGAISLFWAFRDLFLTMQLVVMISNIDDVIVVKMRFALETVD